MKDPDRANEHAYADLCLASMCRCPFQDCPLKLSFRSIHTPPRPRDLMAAKQGVLWGRLKTSQAELGHVWEGEPRTKQSFSCTLHSSCRFATTAGTILIVGDDAVANPVLGKQQSAHTSCLPSWPFRRRPYRPNFPWLLSFSTH